MMHSSLRLSILVLAAGSVLAMASARISLNLSCADCILPVFRNQAAPQRVTCSDTREKAIDRSPVNPSPPVAGVFAFRLGLWPSPVYGLAPVRQWPGRINT